MPIGKLISAGIKAFAKSKKQTELERLLSAQKDKVAKLIKSGPKGRVATEKYQLELYENAMKRLKEKANANR